MHRKIYENYNEFNFCKNWIIILGYFQELTDQAWSFIFDKREDPWKANVDKSIIKSDNKRYEGPHLLWMK